MGRGKGGGLYGLSEQRLKLNTFQSPYAAAAASLRYRFAPCYVPHSGVPFLSSVSGRSLFSGVGYGPMAR